MKTDNVLDEAQLLAVTGGFTPTPDPVRSMRALGRGLVDPMVPMLEHGPYPTFKGNLAGGVMAEMTMGIPAAGMNYAQDAARQWRGLPERKL